MTFRSVNPMSGMSRRAILTGSAALVGTVGPFRAFAGSARQPTDPFIEKLIKRMTLEEKAGQLTMTMGRGIARRLNPVTGPEPQLQQLIDDIGQGRLSGLWNSDDVAFSRSLQEAAVGKSRLKIPLIFAADVIHGLTTAFPVPLAETASFDTDLAYRTARATALEATAFGVQWTFAPGADIARDQRWGRVVETAGEDPWLAARMVEARVRGFQGPDLRAEDSLLACPKHFVGYGAVQGGLDYNTADISEATLRQVHLPPFQAAFDAGAITTMAGFNDVGGTPATGSRHLLTQLLRGEMGFSGLVVSDYQSELELVNHGYAADPADAVLKAITAGCDVSLQGGHYLNQIPGLVAAGRLQVSVVDEAVRRVLRVKKALGLFDNPFRSLRPERLKSDMRKPQTVALAREAARKSMVLLKNDGDLLPLPKSGKTIALIGPFVSGVGDTLGVWMVFPDTDNAVSLEAGFRAALPAGAALKVAPGCRPEAPIEGGIAAAVAAAQAADIVVLHVGEATAMTGEAASRTEIVLPAIQRQLIEAVSAVGKPTVVLLKQGRALELPSQVRDAEAILCTWFLGSESGHAIADVVFGDYAPQGRLPISFPLRSGQQPFYYNHRPTGRPADRRGAGLKARYKDAPGAPLYPFGHGIGYSTIDYGPTELAATSLEMDGTLKVKARISNTGGRSHREVAQLYIRDKVADPAQAVRLLKAIASVDLAAGQSAVVEFTLSAKDLAYVQADLRFSAQAGEFDVWIAPNAEAGAPATFTLLDESGWRGSAQRRHAADL